MAVSAAKEMDVIERAYADKERSYFSADRADMLRFVPEGCTRVLEVGCGAGGFGALVRRTRGAHVTGVERDPVSAAAAEERLDRVLAGDFQAVAARLPDAHYDCAALNDVIEHVFDPMELLKGVAAKLRAGGTVVASIPNVRYFRVLGGLLFRRDWRYEESGVLDFTHIRFFTRKSIERLFEECGLEVERCEPIGKTKSLRPFLYAMVTFGGIGLDSRFKQYAVVARKRA